MIDRKQVIYDIERCTCHVPDACRDCSKYKEGYPAVICMEKLLNDVLEVLKEPEPKQTIRKQEKRKNADGSVEYFAEWYCPHCGKSLVRGFAAPWVKFCFKCGQKVKWE